MFSRAEPETLSRWQVTCPNFLHCSASLVLKDSASRLHAVGPLHCLWRCVCEHRCAAGARGVTMAAVSGVSSRGEAALPELKRKACAVSLLSPDCWGTAGPASLSCDTTDAVPVLPGGERSPGCPESTPGTRGRRAHGLAPCLSTACPKPTGSWDHFCCGLSGFGVFWNVVRFSSHFFHSRLCRGRFRGCRGVAVG